MASGVGPAEAAGVDPAGGSSIGVAVRGVGRVCDGNVANAFATHLSHGVAAWLVECLRGRPLTCALAVELARAGPFGDDISRDSIRTLHARARAENLCGRTLLRPIR